MRLRQWALAALMAGAVPICVMPARADESDPVDRLFENYVASAAAAKTCGGVDPAQDDAFIRNLNVVRQGAERRLAQARGIDEQHARQLFDRSGAGITQGVSRYIEARGCGDESVAHLLQMYRFHAIPGLLDRMATP